MTWGRPSTPHCTKDDTTGIDASGSVSSSASNGFWVDGSMSSDEGLSSKLELSSSGDGQEDSSSGFNNLFRVRSFGGIDGLSFLSSPNLIFVYRCLLLDRESFRFDICFDMTSIKIPPPS